MGRPIDRQTLSSNVPVQGSVEYLNYVRTYRMFAGSRLAK